MAKLEIKIDREKLDARRLRDENAYLKTLLHQTRRAFRNQTFWLTRDETKRAQGVDLLDRIDRALSETPPENRGTDF